MVSRLATTPRVHRDKAAYFGQQLCPGPQTHASRQSACNSNMWCFFVGNKRGIARPNWVWIRPSQQPLPIPLRRFVCPNWVLDIGRTDVPAAAATPQRMPKAAQDMAIPPACSCFLIDMFASEHLDLSFTNSSVASMVTQSALLDLQTPANVWVF